MERGNVNYQIISALNGISKCEELNKKYCFKTRTDQRFYKYDLLDYLNNVMRSYQSCESNLHSRIVMMSYTNGSCNKAFDICDFCAFGESSVLKNFYLCPLEDKNYDRSNINSSKIKYKEVGDMVNELEFNCNDIEIGYNQAYVDYIKNVLCPEIYLVFNYIKYYLKWEAENQNYLHIYRLF